MSAVDALPPRLARWFTFAREAADRGVLDVVLVLAVIERESKGGEALTPTGPAGTGDHGNGLGLMQIDRRFFPEFANATLPDGRLKWQDPRENILFGTRLLSRNIAAFNDVRLGLAAYNCGAHRVRQVCVALERHNPPREIIYSAVDTHTTSNYSAGVMRIFFDLKEMITTKGSA